jgi:uncharacterized protein
MGPIAGIDRWIPAGARIALDTAPFIYYIEPGSAFAASATYVFEACILAGRNQASTCVITLAEVLALPMAVGRHDLVRAYRAIITATEDVQVIPITTATAELAASLRSRLRIALPDALHVAAALEASADVFVTNDRRLARVSSVIDVVVLSDVS